MVVAKFVLRELIPSSSLVLFLWLELPARGQRYPCYHPPPKKKGVQSNPEYFVPET